MIATWAFLCPPRFYFYNFPLRMARNFENTTTQKHVSKISFSNFSTSTNTNTARVTMLVGGGGGGMEAIFSRWYVRFPKHVPWRRTFDNPVETPFVLDGTFSEKKGKLAGSGAQGYGILVPRATREYVKQFLIESRNGESWQPIENRRTWPKVYSKLEREVLYYGPGHPSTWTGRR